MTFERRQGPQLLTYGEWKVKFRKDCENEDKLLAFDSLGEYTLKLLWENGLDPTVGAIVGSIGKPLIQPGSTENPHRKADEFVRLALPRPNGEVDGLG